MQGNDQSTAYQVDTSYGICTDALRTKTDGDTRDPSDSKQGLHIDPQYLQYRCNLDLNDS